MKTTDEILKTLKQCMGGVLCNSCPYIKHEDCQEDLHKDAAALIRQLQDENRALRTELDVNMAEKNGNDVPMYVRGEKPWGQYWQNICDLNARQEAKGKKKYGEPLEENTTLTTTQRIEHAQEEAIDLLKYLEHLKQVAEDGITANDYQRAAMRTAGDNEENFLLNGVMGLCGEAGEVIDLVKKHMFQGHGLDRDKVAEELGDVLWYCALVAEAIKFPLGLVMEMNISKLVKRYPEGFSKERSVNRDKD